LRDIVAYIAGWSSEGMVAVRNYEEAE